MNGIEILDADQQVVNEHFRELFSLLEDKTIKNIADNYTLNAKERKVDIGFNLFTTISHIYHQENFHSDILRAILDPNGKHNEGDKYLKLFLAFLQEKGANINPSEYNNAKVYREKGNIDLLIEDAVSKKAIIIESKINDAIDMDRQLPRYWDTVTNKYQCKCDAIVYLRLNQNKSLDKKNWSNDEKIRISGLIFQISAYDTEGDDLLNGWIYKAEKMSTHIDVLLILRQYGSLIKHLGGNMMNQKIMEDFYNEIIKGDNFKTAERLIQMMADLPGYRKENIINEYKKNPSPFEEIANWIDKKKNFVVIFRGLKAPFCNIELKIRLYNDRSQLELFENKNNGGNLVKLILDKMDYKYEFLNPENVNHCKIMEFKFPNEEPKMFEFIEEFNNKLSEILPSLAPNIPISFTNTTFDPYKPQNEEEIITTALY